MWKNWRQLVNSSTPRRKNVKTRESPAILNLWLRKTLSGNSQDCRRDYIVFDKLSFQNVSRAQENEKPVFSNSSSSKSVHEKPGSRHEFVDRRPSRWNKAVFFSDFSQWRSVHTALIVATCVLKIILAELLLLQVPNERKMYYWIVVKRFDQ